MKVSDIDLPSNRKFGFFFAGIFSLAGAYFFFKEAPGYGAVLSGVTFTFIVVALLKPELLLPLNKAWMKLGFLLGRIVNPIVLGVIFFGMFTPIALLMKLIGRDELQLKPRDSASYWKAREPADGVDSFKNQF